MMRAQLIPAFIGALLTEGVEPEVIERAVSHVRSIKLGHDRFKDPTHRAFANEQDCLLLRALSERES